MKPATWLRVREVFDQALTLPRAERELFVTSACEGEEEVHREVLELLEQDARDADFLEWPASSTVDPSPGSRIGRYRLARVIASGGMGTVYEALQEEPRRSVALKTMRFGLRSPDSVRRFRFEAEVLGRLRHPDIAQVFESGVHREGGVERPYFAMELVEGARDLLTYTREEGLSIRERIQLFARICDAIHYGHQQGVIHRDLKPGNVLIDPSGNPKVIDFGVARATTEDGAAPPPATLTGQIVGTLQYMSPEQVRGGSASVDTRSDVYALGCLLYQLVCGRAPYDVAGRPLQEIARVIETEEPARPDGLAHELSWILRKSLAKEPGQRYPSASEFAADLRRFLDHQPVLAGPPSAVYRVRKFLRRHRVFLGSVASVVAALSIGILRADQQTRAANREAEKAAAVSGFLRSILTAVGPLARGKETRMFDVLTEAASALDREMTVKPDVRALLQNIVGETYCDMRLFDEAEPYLDRAGEYVADLAPDDPLRIDVLANRARLLFGRYQHQEAEALLREVEPLALAALGPEHDLTLKIQGTLCQLLMHSSRLDEAEERYDAHIDVLVGLHGPSHVESLAYMGGRALVWQGQGRLEDAVREFERVLATTLDILPPDHWRVMNAKQNLSRAYLTSGEFGRAESLIREVVENARTNFGESAYLVIAQYNLGLCLREQGRLDEALASFEEGLDGAIAVFGEDNAMVEAILEIIAGLRADIEVDR